MKWKGFIIGTLVVALLLSVGVSANYYSIPEPFKYRQTGDTNSNRKIDAADALEILQYCVGQRGQFSGASLWQDAGDIYYLYYATSTAPVNREPSSESMPEKEFTDPAAYAQWIESLPPPPEGYSTGENNTFFSYIQPRYQEMFFYDRFYLRFNPPEGLTVRQVVLFPTYINHIYEDAAGNDYWYSYSLKKKQEQPKADQIKEIDGIAYYIDTANQKVTWLYKGYEVSAPLILDPNGNPDLKDLQTLFTPKSLGPMNDTASLLLGDTTGDRRIGADDALEVLQYSVEKRKNFSADWLQQSTPTLVILPHEPVEFSTVEQFTYWLRNAPDMPRWFDSSIPRYDYLRPGYQEMFTNEMMYLEPDVPDTQNLVNIHMEPSQVTFQYTAPRTGDVYYYAYSTMVQEKPPVGFIQAETPEGLTYYWNETTGQVGRFWENKYFVTYQTGAENTVTQTIEEKVAICYNGFLAKDKPYYSATLCDAIE